MRLEVWANVRGLMLLANRTLLLVDPDGEWMEGLARHLRAEGAKCFSARDAATAAWAVHETLPDAVVSELEIPDLDGTDLLAHLRSSPEHARLPALALTAHPLQVLQARARGAGFEKYLVKPVGVLRVTAAICCLLGDRSLPEPGSLPAEPTLEESVGRHDYRFALAALNASTSHRYSALFMFEDTALQSLWTFDRARPTSDPFPLALPLHETPLALLAGHNRALEVEDASRDPRLTPKQLREEMRSLLAVPLAEDEAPAFGALCHFDDVAQPANRQTLETLEHAARAFRRLRKTMRSSLAPRA